MRGCRAPSLYQLFLAHIQGRQLPDVSAVNTFAEHPGPIPQLTSTGQLRLLVPDPVPGALSVLARDEIDVLAGPLSGRLRECAAPDCAFLFVDTSRPGVRRWCAHSRCGNRQNVRAHRSRRKQQANSS